MRMVLIIFPRVLPKGEKAEVKQIKAEIPSYMG